MTILDANLLLYAYNERAPQRQVAEKWLQNLLAGGEIIAIPWVTVWAFIRIGTNRRISDEPMSTGQAFEIVAEWLSQPGVVLLQPGPRHLEILRSLVTQNDAGGALLTDAVLAAFAIENGAVLASADRDFARFKGLRWVNPLEP